MNVAITVVAVLDIVSAARAYGSRMVCGNRIEAESRPSEVLLVGKCCVK